MCFARLGSRGEFQAVAPIAPGEDFTVRTDRALDESDAVLAIIGQGWLRRQQLAEGHACSMQRTQLRLGDFSSGYSTAGGTRFCNRLLLISVDH